MDSKDSLYPGAGWQLYATLVLIGLFNLTGYAAAEAIRLTTTASQAHLVYAGWVAQLATQPSGTVFAMSTTFAILISPYLVRVWIGQRCDRLGIVTVTMAALLAKAVDSTMSYILINPQGFEALFGPTKDV